MSMQRVDIYRLVDALPENELPMAKRFLEFLILRSDNGIWEAFMKAPEDGEPLDEDDLLGIEKAEKDIAEGRVKPLEQVARELGYENRGHFPR